MDSTYEPPDEGDGRKNTDNFYSAEGVLDQICTGLQGDISKAYSAGYTKVMENYSDSSINEAGRQSIFAQEYLKSLKGSLESDNTGMHYKTEKLKDYVDSKLTDENSKPHAVVKAVNADEMEMDCSRYTTAAQSLMASG